MMRHDYGGVPNDLSGRFRLQATQPGYLVYIVPRNLRVAVLQTPAPISQNHIPTMSVVIQADNANGGIVCLGGPDLTLLNGTELTAGQGAIIYPGEVPGDYTIRTALGIGVERMQAISAGGPQAAKVRVVSLGHVWLVGSAPGQIARVQYMPYTL